MNAFKAVVRTPLLTLGTLLLLFGSNNASAQKALSGAQIFAAKCQACHSVDRAKGSTMAPNLAGIIGRKAGTMPRFSYSPAIARSKIVWNAGTLDAFVAGPQRAVPGNRMAFSGMVNAKERAELIAFLSGKK